MPSQSPMARQGLHTLPSYLQPDKLGPWGTYLQQVDRVAPYLGHMSRWLETLKRPKRALIVDVPIQLDNGTVAHFELAPGRVSLAVVHRTVEEIWYIVGGRGEMWREQGGRERWRRWRLWMQRRTR